MEVRQTRALRCQTHACEETCYRLQDSLHSERATVVSVEFFLEVFPKNLKSTAHNRPFPYWRVSWISGTNLFFFILGPLWYSHSWKHRESSQIWCTFTQPFQGLSLEPWALTRSSPCDDTSWATTRWRLTSPCHSSRRLVACRTCQCNIRYIILVYIRNILSLLIQPTLNRWISR